MSDSPPNPEPTPENEEDEVLLPPPEAREWLLTQLSELVRARGAGPLVTAPLVEPIPEYFPDPWAGGEPSVRRLARRLLRYAGVEDVPVEVTVLDEGTAIAAGTSGVSFEGLKKGTLEFAVQTAALRDPMIVVPAMARAVAEAYRRVHRLPTGDSAPHQRMVDVTAVYLGFGLLTANAALRIGGSSGGWGRQSNRTRTRLGVLDPQSVGFLLATQLHARGLSDKQHRAVLRKLAANPAGFVRAAAPVLAGLEPPLAERLGLPPKDQWPPAPDLDVLTGPFEDEDAEDEQAEPEERKDEDRGVKGMNAGKPVFRVERSKALRLAKMLAMPTVMLGMLAGRMQIGVDFPMWQAGVAAVVLGALGLGVGRLLPDRRCSEPKCGTELDPDVEVCPLCGGTIAGVISHPRERLAAEEDLARRGGMTANDDPEDEDEAPAKGDTPADDADPPERTISSRAS